MAITQLTKTEFSEKIANLDSAISEWHYLGSRPAIVDFYATWCGPCQREMPDIQAMYEDLGLNEEDVVVLAVANPKSDQYPYNQDVSEDEVKRFLEENGYTYPVAMDTTGEVFAAYGVRAFPTTFMIDREGNVFGYVESTLTRDIMDSIVQQTLDGRRAG